MYKLARDEKKRILTRNHELVDGGGGQANVRGRRRSRQPESDRRPHGSYPGRLLSARGASCCCCVGRGDRDDVCPSHRSPGSDRTPSVSASSFLRAFLTCPPPPSSSPSSPLHRYVVVDDVARAPNQRGTRRRDRSSRIASAGRSWPPSVPTIAYPASRISGWAGPAANTNRTKTHSTSSLA